MKLRLPFVPLFVQIVGWFFLNLAVLTAGIGTAIYYQGKSGRDWFPTDPSPSQTQGMALALITRLAQNPREEWGGILEEEQKTYRMEFALYAPPSPEKVVGADLELPDEVRGDITFLHRPPPLAQPGVPQRLDPQEQAEAAARPPGGPGPDGPPGPPPPPVQSADPNRPDVPLAPYVAQAAKPGPPSAGNVIPTFPRRGIRIGTPPAYWLTVHLPFNRLHRPDLPMMVLVGRSATLDSPLLFNPRPWIVLALALSSLSVVFWLPLARNFTAALARMTRTTEEIAAGKLDVHVRDNRRDELGRLGAAINRMASGLEGHLAGQRRFLGDVAHELTSPLARMEIALGILEARGAGADEKTKAYLHDVADEVTHMRKLAHDLLSFSKASLGEAHVKLERVSLAEAAAAAVRRERAGERVAVEVPDSLFATANAEMLERAVSNLVRNALRYAGGDGMGPITVVGWAEGTGAFLAVRDEGPGVPPGEGERLFEPFYRVDTARTRESGGAGLGLAIVKSCVGACLGTVSARNRHPRGLEVTIGLSL